MRALIVHTPISGRGTAAARLEAVQAALQADLAEAHAAGEAESIAAVATDYEVLLAAGGDGVVHEVINGLMQRAEPRPRLGILPLGTGNDIARNLAVLDVDEALQCVLDDTIRDIDLLRIEVPGGSEPRVVYGGLNCGIGLGAAVIRATTRRVKRIFGPTMAYNVGTLRALARWRSPLVRMRWDDGAFEGRAMFLAAGNAEYEGGGSMRMSPGSRIDDGLFWVTLIRHGSKLDLLRNFGRLAKGTHPEHPLVDYFPATRLEVDCEPAVEAQSDGDVIGFSPVTITVCPRAMTVYAPAGDQHG